MNREGPVPPIPMIMWIRFRLLVRMMMMTTTMIRSRGRLLRRCSHPLAILVLSALIPLRMMTMFVDLAVAMRSIRVAWIRGSRVGGLAVLFAKRTTTFPNHDQKERRIPNVLVASYQLCNQHGSHTELPECLFVHEWC